MALEENNQEEKRVKNLEMIYRLESEDGKKADIVLHDVKNFAAFKKNIAESYGKENGVELVELKDGRYAHIIYPSSPLYKEIKEMIKDLKAGKKPKLSKELEEMLFSNPGPKKDKEISFANFSKVPEGYKEPVPPLPPRKNKSNALEQSRENFNRNSNRISRISF